MFDKRLADALDFTEAELIANREGRITDEQYKKLRGWTYFTSCFAIFGVAFMAGLPLVGILLSLNAGDSNLCLIPLYTVVLLVAIAIGISFFFEWRAYVIDCRERSVVSFQSLLSVGKGSSRGRTWTHLYIVMNGKEVTFTLHTDNGAVFDLYRSYRVYYAPHSRFVFSIEPI